MPGTDRKGLSPFVRQQLQRRRIGVTAVSSPPKAVGMNISSFAEAIAQRLDSIVPAGFHVHALDGDLYFSAGSHTFRKGGQAVSRLRENFELNGSTTESRIVRSAEQALDQLQEFVEEESAAPWPSGKDFPAAHAQLREASLFLWFGDAAAPALACAPIDIE